MYAFRGRGALFPWEGGRAFWGKKKRYSGEFVLFRREVPSFRRPKGGFATGAPKKREKRNVTPRSEAYLNSFSVIGKDEGSDEGVNDGCAELLYA